LLLPLELPLITKSSYALLKNISLLLDCKGLIYMHISLLKALLVKSILPALMVFGLFAQASADTIAIIGTGNVASTFGPKFADLGHEIIYGSREPQREDVLALVRETGNGASALTPAESVIDADIVVIAVPGLVVESVVAGLGDLSGKIIMDVTNPTHTVEGGLRVHAVETSNAEIIQNMAPEAFVVKAFNTLNYRTMLDPQSAGGPVTIPLAGNDTAAKAKVAELAEGIGFETSDVGPVRYAHELEGMLILFANARAMGHTFNYYFRTPL
jgi:predicted dinucleotide-binding enzyme